MQLRSFLSTHDEWIGQICYKPVTKSGLHLTDFGGSNRSDVESMWLPIVDVFVGPLPIYTAGSSCSFSIPAHLTNWNVLDQVEEHVRVMLEEGPCLGSVSTSSPTSDLFMHVGETQDRLLSIFNTNRNDYSVVFTTGFQASYHVVAESYPFHKGSPLLVCQDNHDSVRQVIDYSSCGVLIVTSWRSEFLPWSRI